MVIGADVPFVTVIVGDLGTPADFDVNFSLSRIRRISSLMTESKLFWYFSSDSLPLLSLSLLLLPLLPLLSSDVSTSSKLLLCKLLELSNLALNDAPFWYRTSSSALEFNSPFSWNVELISEMEKFYGENRIHENKFIHKWNLQYIIEHTPYTHTHVNILVLCECFLIIIYLFKCWDKLL